MSYKYFNYMKVLEVHNMMLNKEHLSDIGRSEILAIKEKSHNNSQSFTTGGSAHNDRRSWWVLRTLSGLI